jgi:hypothetical protein
VKPASIVQNLEGIIIFCNTVSDAESLASALDIMLLHGQLDSETFDDRIAQLRTRTVRSAVATSVLGVAFDVPDIRYVLQFRTPRSADDHEQQTGRCGRDGKLAWVYTFVGSDDTYKLPPEPDYWGVEAVRLHTTDTQICRRARTDLALHGITRTCVELQPCHYCDICARDSQLHDGTIHTPSAYPSSLIQKYLTPIATQPDVSTFSESIASSSFKEPVLKTNTPIFTTSISTQPPSSQSTEIQISTQYSQSAFPSSLHPPHPHSQELLALRNALDHFASTCIDCWLHRRSEVQNHSFEHCQFGLHAVPQYTNWVSSLRFSDGTCFGCGCPQRVCILIFLPFDQRAPY